MLPLVKSWACLLWETFLTLPLFCSLSEGGWYLQAEFRIVCYLGNTGDWRARKEEASSFLPYPHWVVQWFWQWPSFLCGSLFTSFHLEVLSLSFTLYPMGIAVSYYANVWLLHCLLFWLYTFSVTTVSNPLAL